MSRKANHFKIGLFVIVALIIAATAIIIFGAGALFREKILAETYIDESVQGLEIGAAVRYRGVKVGKITDISFTHIHYPADPTDTDNTRYVLVRFSVYPNIFRGATEKNFGEILEREINEHNLRCRLSGQGITGVLYLEIDYTEGDAAENKIKITWKPDPAYFFIPSVSSTFTRWSETAEEIVAKIDLVLGKLESLKIEPVVDELAGLLKAVTTQVNDIKLADIRAELLLLLSDFRKSSDEFQKLITKPEVDEILKSAAETVANTASATKRFEDLLSKPEIDATLKSASHTASTLEISANDLQKFLQDSESQVQDILKTVNSAAKRIDNVAVQVNQFAGDGQLADSLTHVESVLRRLDKLVAEQQRNVETILENIRRVSEDLKELSRTARDNPSGVLFGGPPKRTSLEERK